MSSTPRGLIEVLPSQVFPWRFSPVGPCDYILQTTATFNRYDGTFGALVIEFHAPAINNCLSS